MVAVEPRHLGAPKDGSSPRVSARTKWRVVRRMSLTKSVWWSTRFGARIIVGRGVTMAVRRGARIRVAPGGALVIGIDQNRRSRSLLEVHPGGEVRALGTVSICRGAKFVVGATGRLTIGANTYFNDGCTVICYAATSVGADSAVAWGVTITDTDMHTVIDAGREAHNRAGVTIGDHCWVGANATVLKGVRLEDDVVVAAGAVLTRGAPAGSLVAGNPARVVKTDQTWRH